MADQLVRTRLHHLDIPLVAPFRTATGVVANRSVVLVAVGDGVVGWGEAAPYPGQDETIEDLVERARASSASPALAAALDEALHDHAARRNGVPLHLVTATEVPVSVALGIDDALERAAAFAELGVARFKVKIAPGAIDHLVALREAYPDALLGVDGNRSFESMDRHDLGVVVDTGVVYAEEVFTDWVSGAAEAFVDLSGIPLFADESVRSIADVQRLVALPAVRRHHGQTGKARVVGCPRGGGNGSGSRKGVARLGPPRDRYRSLLHRPVGGRPVSRTI